MSAAAATASVGGLDVDDDDMADGPDIEWRDAPGGSGKLQFAVRDRALLNKASYITGGTTSTDQ